MFELFWLSNEFQGVVRPVRETVLRKQTLVMTAINTGFTFAGLEPLGSSSTELLGVWPVGASALSADKVKERREEHHLPRIITVCSD